MEQTKKEFLLKFTDKIKFRSKVKEQNMVGACAEPKLLMMDSDYATHATIKAFGKK